MKLLFVVMILLLPLLAGAATYSWTDTAGTIHFTDDLGSVPKNYRAKALQKASSEEAGLQPAPAGIETPAGQTGTPAAAAAPAADQKGAVVTVPAGEKTDPSTRFGDRTAAEWQAQFRGLRSELSTLEQKRVALKQEGGDGKKILSRQQVADINARNKQLYDEYEAARQRFNSLVEQANKAGLPPEFAQ